MKFLFRNKNYIFIIFTILFVGSVLLLERQIILLQKEVRKLSELVSLSTTTLSSTQYKSDPKSLTEQVKNVSPSVVSIVASKDMPKLVVRYTKPFGNDPFFESFGFQIPVFQQIGTQKEQVGAGTGFLISSNGYILTNRHVVFDLKAEYTVLLASGEKKVAKVVYQDPNNDLAVIKIEGNNYKPVVLGDSSKLELGQNVVAIGNALGEYNNSVSTGVVSGLNRTLMVTDRVTGIVEKLSGVIQTDAAINLGNSGGPLLDQDGKVVGVNVATVAGSNNISFSIPINSVLPIINKFKKT